MKKTITLFPILALLLCVVSCQISGIDNSMLKEDGFTITAVIDNSDATRMNFAVDNQAYTITPSWAVGDVIFGVDDSGVLFNFQVDSVSGNKGFLKSNSYRPQEGAVLYAFYANNDQSAWANQRIVRVPANVDAGELGNKSSVVMTSKATVTNGGLSFVFEKRTAIMGIKKMKIPASDANIVRVRADGLYAYADFVIEDGEIKMKPGPLGTVYTDGQWEIDADGVCDTPFYFNIFPQESAVPVLRVEVPGHSGYAVENMIGPVDIQAGRYYHMTKIMTEAAVYVDDIGRCGSIEEAFAVADRVPEATIKLLKDCTARDTLKLSNPNGVYTLDLNGKTLMTDAASVVVVEGASLTLTDNSTNNPAEYGTLATAETNTNKYVVNVRNEGTFVVEKGKIFAPEYRGVFYTTGSGGAIRGNGSISTPKGMSVVVGATGGHVDVEGDVQIAGLGNVIYCYGGSCTITGGYISNTNVSALVYAGGDGGSVVTVSGGYFKTTNINTIAYSEGCEAYVSGGCHSVAVRENYAKDVEGNLYYNAPNPDNETAGEYPYTLVPKAGNPLVATVTSASYIWKHASIESAGMQADLRSKNTAATTLKLETDLNANGTFAFRESHKYLINVDMNGHKLVSTASPALMSECPILVYDSGGEGAIITTGAIALQSTGNLTIGGGSFESTGNAVVIGDNADLVINNGYFYGGAQDIARGGAGATVTIAAGWFKNSVDAAYIEEGCAANAATKTHLGKTYNYQVSASSVVATVGDTGYASYSKAVAAAQILGGVDTVRMVLQADIAGAPALSLENINLPVLLDLNGHTLSSADSAFIKCQYDLTIVDKGAVRGKITSSASNVICKAGTGTINLKGVTVECTKASAPNFYGSGVVYLNNSASTVNISEGCKIYSTASVAAITNRAGTLTIADSEVSSGTVSAGLPAVCNGGTSATTTINSGSFFTSATSRAVVVNAAGLAKTTSAGSVIINDGYFYASSNAIVLKGNYAGSDVDHMPKIIVNGGYFNKSTVWTSSSTNYPPTYGEGKSEQTVSPAATHTHETMGQTYEYRYQVK